MGTYAQNTAETLKRLRVGSAQVLNKLLLFGWVDSGGSSQVWWNWQRKDHDEQFAEERERKPSKGKFKKDKR